MRIIFRPTLAVAAALAALIPASALAADGDAAPNVQSGPATVRFDNASGAVSRSTPVGSAKADSCTKSSVIGERAYVIRADMYKVTGAKSMRVRFRAFRTLPGEAEKELSLDGSEKLGTWEASVPAGSSAVSHLVFYKRLYSLNAPATFRATVDFEWYGSGNTKIKSIYNVGVASCVQPDLRPDLYVEKVTVSAVVGKASSLRYRITVRNQGKGRSAASKLQVRVPIGSAIKTFTPVNSQGRELLIGRIDEAGSKRKASSSDPIVLSRTVLIDAERCSSGNAVIEVDPGNLLDESSGSNNVYPIAVSCSDPTPPS